MLERLGSRTCCVFCVLVEMLASYKVRVYAPCCRFAAFVLANGSMSSEESGEGITETAATSRLRRT
jgi:hypothetical protein